jgi:hypothetical protein
MRPCRPPSKFKIFRSDKIILTSFLCGPVKTNQWHLRKLDMATETPKINFLGIKDSANVEYFPPSVNFGVTVDHYIVLKSCFRVNNLIVEFSEVSKTGLGIKIGQPSSEIFEHSLQKPWKKTIFGKAKIGVCLMTDVSDFSIRKGH